MPIYEYACETCHHQFEVQQKFSDPLIEKCTRCGNAVRKLISAPGIMFKGTGWYVTDYSNKLKDPSLSKSDGGNRQDATKREGDAASAPAKSDAGSATQPAAPAASSSSTPPSSSPPAPKTGASPGSTT